jgi:putative hemolysin
MEEILIILFCIFVNALFACFEMAFVTVTRPQLRKLAKAGNRSAEKLLKLRDNPERTLSVVQIGITLVGLISAAVGGAGAKESFAPLFESWFNLSENTAEFVAILTVVLPLTFFNVVLAELVPKTIALRDPLRVSTFGVRGIIWMDRAFSPLVWALEKTTRFILYFLPRKKAPLVEHTAAVEVDHLSTQTQQYVLNLVGVENRKVKEVMVPWENVNRVNESDSVSDVVSAVIRSGHTRLPVFQEGKVVGLLHTKEFNALLTTAPQSWQRLIRPVIQVKESELALKALRQMQEKRSHIAIVIDQFANPLGIVTLEDIIEEIVGDIYDEDDDGRMTKLIANQVRFKTPSF